MAIFDNMNFKPVSTKLDDLVGKLTQALSTVRAVNPTTARTALTIGTESHSDTARNEMRSAAQDLQSIMESLVGELKIGVESYNSIGGKDSKKASEIVLKSQIEAAAAAGILAGNPTFFMARDTKMASVSTESMRSVPAAIADAVEKRPAMEAYDERDNKNAAAFSMAYNMQASRQDEFCETFFPTIVVTPDNVGFSVTVRMFTVMNEFLRNTSGAVDNFNRKNVIRALADPTILKNETTRMVPVVRANSLGNFVAAGVIPARSYNLEGEMISTAPLAVGKTFSLIALSQPDAILLNGAMDVTDTIDPAIELAALYIKVGDDILKVNTGNLPRSQFTYVTQGSYRDMALSFKTDSVLINKDTKRFDGSPLTTLANVVTNDLVVRVSLNASGEVNIETGTTVVFGNAVSAFTVQDSTGLALDKTAAPALNTVTALASATIIGYDLKAYRSNANRRQRGQLINTEYFTQLYNVPLRTPITAIHPVNQDGQTDSADLTALIVTTRIRTSNAGVTELLNNVDQLREYFDARDTAGVGPDILGTGRYFVKHSFFEETIDMTDIVDSLTSTGRPEDIQSALVNQIRDYVYRMFRDSEYKAAADALSGGLAAMPTPIVGTDPVLSRWLTVTGDTRTLGNDFNMKIVSSLDNRVKNKIFITFGVFDENRNVAPNPLNYGNMAWSPELTLVLPISRNGQISKELAVSPRFRHLVNLPIMTVLTITGMPDVMGKVSINMNSTDVTPVTP